MDSPTPNNNLPQFSAILYQGSVVAGAATRFHKGDDSSLQSSKTLSLMAGSYPEAPSTLNLKTETLDPDPLKTLHLNN